MVYNNDNDKDNQHVLFTRMNSGVDDEKTVLLSSSPDTCITYELASIFLVSGILLNVSPFVQIFHLAQLLSCQYKCYRHHIMPFWMVEWMIC